MVRVLVPIADGCEELEAVTIIDILRRAGFEVVVAGLTGAPVKASRGVVLVPDCALDAVLDQDFALMVLPGGLAGAERLDADPRITMILRRLADQGAYIAAICAAPRVLLHAGLLDGRKVTAYPGVLDNACVGCEVGEESVVVDGHLVTSRGPGTAMEFALVLIERLGGAAMRREVELPLLRH